MATPAKQPATYALGENITVSVEGNIATFTVDLSADLGPSASGKSNLVAKSGASAPFIPGTDVQMNATLYRKVAKPGLKAV